MKIHDITRTVSPQIVIWPGDQQYQPIWTTTISENGVVNVGAITMSTHTGTHADAPHHYAEHGIDVSEQPLENYIGPALVMEIENSEIIEIAHVEHLDFNNVKRILFKTKSSRLSDSEWIDDIVWLGTETAEYLGKHGVRLVGMDGPSVDRVDSKELPTHQMLMKYNISNLENLALRNIAPGMYELVALPLKLEGLDASPVRAILIERK